jgi:hypothetical protein
MLLAMFPTNALRSELPYPLIAAVLASLDSCGGFWCRIRHRR